MPKTLRYCKGCDRGWNLTSNVRKWGTCVTLRLAGLQAARFVVRFMHFYAVLCAEHVSTDLEAFIWNIHNLPLVNTFHRSWEER